MSRVNSGISSLRKAFRAHLANATNSCPSHYMLKFYATECGLKCILANRNYNVAGNDELAQLSVSHNLMDLVKELRLPKRVSSACVDFKTVSGHNYSITRLHEAWRYGVSVKPESETQVLKWLEDVCVWIEGEI